MTRNHPYKRYETHPAWQVVTDELESLRVNRDIEITTAREYVVGSLCKALDQAGLLNTPQSSDGGSTRPSPAENEHST